MPYQPMVHMVAINSLSGVTKNVEELTISLKNSHNVHFVNMVNNEYLILQTS